MMTATEIFLKALNEIECYFPEYQFMMNRDLTWILQKRMNQLIEEYGAPFELYYDYPFEKGCQDRKDNELVFVLKGTNYRDIFSLKAQAELVIRVLFEPSKKRGDICVNHLPHITISQLMYDIEKMKFIVKRGHAKKSICLLIDEYSRHRHQVIPSEQITWIEWGDYYDPGLNVSSLLVQFEG